MTMEHRQHEDIVMLNDILDYLNAHEMRTLLKINTAKLTGLEAIPRTEWSRGDVTVHRELMSIRQALLVRLGFPGDKEHWLKV